MTLDLLIPTTPERGQYLQQLIACLTPQLVSADVGLLILSDDGRMTVGEKRNRLLMRSTADFLAGIDDDDLVSPQYIEKITAALRDRPDCVGFKMRRFYDGIEIGIGINSINCDGYRNDGFTFYRTPGHLNPIRRELALQVMFEPMDRGEDLIFAERIRPLLKTEVFVDEFLYEYWYRSPRARQKERVV